MLDKEKSIIFEQNAHFKSFEYIFRYRFGSFVVMTHFWVVFLISFNLFLEFLQLGHPLVDIAFSVRNLVRVLVVINLLVGVPNWFLICVNLLFICALFLVGFFLVLVKISYLGLDLRQYWWLNPLLIQIHLHLCFKLFKLNFPLVEFSQSQFKFSLLLLFGLIKKLLRGLLSFLKSLQFFFELLNVSVPFGVLFDEGIYQRVRFLLLNDRMGVNFL